MNLVEETCPANHDAVVWLICDDEITSQLVFPCVCGALHPVSGQRMGRVIRVARAPRATRADGDAKHCGVGHVQLYSGTEESGQWLPCPSCQIETESSGGRSVHVSIACVNCATASIAETIEDGRPSRVETWRCPFCGDANTGAFPARLVFVRPDLS